MFCRKCGNKLTEGQKFCNNCGEKVEEIINEESVTESNEVKTENASVMPNETEPVINNNEQMNNNNNFNTYSSVNTSALSNEPKKNSNLPLIIAFILIGIIIIALVVFIVIEVTDKDDNVDNDNPVVEKDDNKNEDDDNKKDEEVKKEIITASNYDYEKLDGYKYVIKSNRLNVTNNSMDFVAALQNMSATYSVLEPQLETLKQRFISTGYTVNNAYSKTYGSTKFLVFEMTYMSQNLILFYAEHPDKTTICGSIQLKSSSYTYEDALRDMSIIINASEKSTEASDDSSESFDSDISDIF